MPSSISSAASSIAAYTNRFEKSAARTAKPDGASDPVKETVEQMTDQNAVAADTQVIRSQDEMVGSLIDIVA